jgi:hypothetical protein
MQVGADAFIKRALNEVKCTYTNVGMAIFGIACTAGTKLPCKKNPNKAINASSIALLVSILG